MPAERKKPSTCSFYRGLAFGAAICMGGWALVALLVLALVELIR